MNHLKLRAQGKAKTVTGERETIVGAFVSAIVMAEGSLEMMGRNDTQYKATAKKAQLISMMSGLVRTGPNRTLLFYGFSPCCEVFFLNLFPFLNDVKMYLNQRSIFGNDCADYHMPSCMITYF